VRRHFGDGDEVGIELEMGLWSALYVIVRSHSGVLWQLITCFVTKLLARFLCSADVGVAE